MSLIGQLPTRGRYFYVASRLGEEIEILPEKYQGFCFRRSSTTSKTDSFAEMVEFITDLALAERDKACPSND